MTKEGEVFIDGNLLRLICVEACSLVALSVTCFGQIGSVDERYDSGSGLQRDNNGEGWFRILCYGPGAIITGTFTNVNGTNRNHVARLDESGGLDLSFNPGSGVRYSGVPTVQAVTIQPDGKVIIGGSFTNVNGFYRNRMARLNSDGSVDESFECNPGPNSNIERILLQPDGKLLVGGHFTQWSLRNRRFVVRLQPDGRSDYLYDTSWNTVQPIGMALQRDGKLIIGGYPDFEPGNSAHILRINSDGTRDFTFHTEMDDSIKALVLEPDGKIAIAGFFERVNGEARINIARLHPDGSTDMSFNVNLPSRLGYINSLARFPDGKWLAGGYFRIEDGYPRNYLMRLNPDGSFDASFDTGLGPNSWVTDSAIQDDGKILIVGDFTSVDGMPRNGVARLYGDPEIHATRIPEGLQISWPAIYTNFSLQSVSTLLSTNWVRVPTAPVTVSNTSVITNPVFADHQFFRLIKP
jgi:uncharacterized delta-60 repeat protein